MLSLVHYFILSAKTPIGTRLAVSGIAVVVGIILIVTGRQNIRTQSAEEHSGRRRMVLRAMGKDTEYKGRTAVSIGVAKVVMGILAIIFAVVFFLFGAFLS